MDSVQIYRILGIEETKDEALIKQAYRAKLVTVNPEDDPEGFKRLRTAYEEACVLAKQKDRAEDEGEEDTTPIGLWIKQVKALYQCFPKRIDPENWVPLLEDELCSDLDTWTEAREALLVYLMDNFRMPSSVFHTIDRYLSLVKDRDELYEKFPKEFVNYLMEQCQGESWLDYHLFEGPDEGDYDGYIRAYFELKDQIDEKKLEGVANRLDELEAFPIRHPYTDVERARFYDLQERYEEAGELFEALSGRYGEDNWILFCHAEHIWNQGDKDRAAIMYQKILAKEPRHYTARIRMAGYALDNGEYEDAKERYASLLGDVNNYPEFLNGLKEANKHLIEQYQKDVTENPDDMEKAFKLGWCYLENERYDECIGFLDTLDPDEDNVCEYHSLKARAYYNANKYPEAAVHFKEWLEAIKRETPKTKEETDQIPLRLAAACSFLCSTYQKLGEKEPENYKTAVEYVDEAYRHEKSIRYLHQKAALLLDIKRYQECVDVCDRVLEEDAQYFPAIVIRQECNYNLRAAQEVIDDFYRALDIYKFYPKMYQFAAQVFFIYHQFDDVMNILKRADEAQVDSRELSYLKGETLWRVAKNDEDRQKALDYLRNVENEWGKEAVEPGELAKLICEEALCLMMMKDYEEALMQINRAISKDTASTYYLYTKADILSRMGKYKEALHLFLVCEKHSPSDDDVLEHIGDCHENMSEHTKALQYYKKALEANPNNRRCNSKIVDIYDDLLDDTERYSYFEEALPYANRQLELTPEAYYYIERGLLFMSVSRWDEAVADFQKAAELEPDNTYAYNNIGSALKNQERIAEAMEALNKAIEVMDGPETPLPYGNLANCYERLGQYDKAVEAYEKDLELFPKRASLYDDLAEVYSIMRQYDKAIAVLLKGRELPTANKHYFSRAIALNYQYKGDIKNAVAYLQEAIKEDKTYGSAYARLGDLCLHEKDQPKMAVKYYKEALDCYEETDTGYYDTCLELMACYWGQGKKSEVTAYFEKAMNALRKNYATLDEYLDSYQYKPSRHFFAGRLFYYMGNLDKAREYFDNMISCNKCRSCSYTRCYEYDIAMGLLEEARGNKKEAIAWYEKSLELDEGGSFQRHRIKKLSEKRLFWK